MANNLIPEGYYTAVAVRVNGEDGDHVARWSKASTGNRSVLIYFEILEGDHRGRRLPWFGYFTKGTSKRTVESLRYCGFKGNDLTDLDNQELNQQVSIQVEHDTYQGDNDDAPKTRVRVAWVNRAGGGTIKLKDPMSRDELRKFAAMMAQSLDKVPEVEGEVYTRAEGGDDIGRDDYDYDDAAVPDDDPGPQQFDDIPF